MLHTLMQYITLILRIAVTASGMTGTCLDTETVIAYKIAVTVQSHLAGEGVTFFVNALMGASAWGVDVAVALDLPVLLRPDAFLVVTLEPFGAVRISLAVEGSTFFVHTLLAIRTLGPLVTIGPIVSRLGLRHTLALQAVETGLARGLSTACRGHTFVVPAHLALDACGPLVAVCVRLEVTGLGEGGRGGGQEE